MMSLTRRLLTLLLGAVLLVGPAMSAAHADPPAAADSGKLVSWGHGGWGLQDIPASPDGSAYSAVSAGDTHSLALTDGGSVVGWGDNGSGQIDVPGSLAGKTVTAIAAGGYHSLALLEDGSVVSWGYNEYGQTNVPESLAGKTVTAIAAGTFHSLALLEDGSVVSWGYDGYGQIDVPGSLAGKTVTAIAGGGYHSLALLEDGSVVGWGRDYEGEATAPESLAGKTVTAIAAGDFHSLALLEDGSVVGWGYDGYGQIDVPGSLAGKTVTAIAGGGYHSLALLEDGSVVGWGYNEYGQIDVPESLAGQTVTSIAGGYYQSLVIVDDRAIVTGLDGDAATVVAGTPLVVTPTVTGAVAEEPTEWTATGTDVTAVIDPETGALTLTSTKAGVHEVTITIPTDEGDLTTVVTLTVTPAAVASLTLVASPASSVLFGDTVTFTATGADAFSNSTGDVTDDVTVTSSAASDTVAGNEVTVGSTGSRTITATHTNGVTKTYALTVGAKTFVTGPTPTIGGTVKVGEQLTADAGSVSPKPDAISWQWYANDVAVDGATAIRFTPTNAQRGTRLSVSATAQRTGYADVTATSAKTAAVASAKAPSISLSSKDTSLRRGQDTTLTWATTDAVDVTASGAWQGSQAPAGQLTVKPGLGSTTWVLQASNDQGTVTAQTSVGVVREAAQLKVSANKRVVSSGKKTTVTATGLDALEPFTIAVAGRVVASGTADARGKVSRKVVVSNPRAGRRIVVVTGSESDRAGRTKVKVTRTPKLTLSDARIQASDRQRVTVRALVPGEKVTVTFKGKRISPRNARADQHGVYSLRFNVGLAWGTKTVTVTTGAGKAKAVFTVVRRTRDLSPRWR